MIVNIGRNDNNLKIIEIAKIIQNLIPKSKINFLQNLGEKKDQLFVDRKIKGGKDNRTYKVSFDKSKNDYGFECNFTVNDGVAKMINDLKKMKLDDKKLKFSGFYRLQHLESLHNKNLIDDDLRWKI